MSKVALYSKVDVFEDDLRQIVIVDVPPDILYCDEYVDGYTELARAKLKQLKVELTTVINSKAKCCYLGIDRLTQIEAVKFVNDDELLQFWCDAASWDKVKVKEWLLTGEVKKRKYNNVMRRNGK